MSNLIAKTEWSLLNKEWNNGLGRYYQDNCQCTLTDNGYRIYRPANLTYPDCGNTTWGGLVLTPMASGIVTFEEGRTYLLSFHVKGQSSVGPYDVIWSNNVGWGSNSLIPKPIDVSCSNWVGWDAFDGEKDFFYKWTCDSIYKVSKTTYAGFEEGKTYLSYHGFKFGFGYESTGTLGTDLYITNLRLHDITNYKDIDVNKMGIVNALEFIEESDFKLLKTGEITSPNMIEI